VSTGKSNGLPSPQRRHGSDNKYFRTRLKQPGAFGKKMKYAKNFVVLPEGIPARKYESIPCPRCHGAPEHDCWFCRGVGAVCMVSTLDPQGGGA
jgi:hypothetical protein